MDVGRPGSDVVDESGVYGSLGVASASNWPGGREALHMCFDSTSEKLYIYGGYGMPSGSDHGGLADLWSLDMSTGQWTWEDGSNLANQAPVYGNIGVASASNSAGGRFTPSAVWCEISSTRLFIFGGRVVRSSTSGRISDLWSIKLPVPVPTDAPTAAPSAAPTAVPTCKGVCAAGKYRRLGCCEDCPIGYFTSTTDNEACLDCSDSLRCNAGTFPDSTCDKTGTASEPECIGGCSPGTHQVNGSGSGNTAACSMDKEIESSWKDLVEKGTCTVVEKVECSPCLPGFYQELPNALSCLKCTVGKYTAGYSSRECANCVSGRSLQRRHRCDRMHCMQGRPLSGQNRRDQLRRLRA
jgi:hypothetical protein